MELRTVDSSERHKNISCEYYGICLDLACLLFWPSFSCVKCGLFQAPADVEKDGVFLKEKVSPEKKGELLRELLDGFDFSPEQVLIDGEPSLRPAIDFNEDFTEVL